MLAKTNIYSISLQGLGCINYEVPNAQVKSYFHDPLLNNINKLGIGHCETYGYTVNVQGVWQKPSALTPIAGAFHSIYKADPAVECIELKNLNTHSINEYKTYTGIVYSKGSCASVGYKYPVIGHV